ncbi:hypothetical protein G5V59_27060 [Nocardioides sp. W3-2-3]|uniref:hypothetical protein n=1 Tax=Nocardioides convexus TaxID=2712224 RepID=UPI0024187133|nr:hypothetical protein [Nocardioides convexus]NHA02053.1 hypothetical protein [Nocardioides convexus]
MGTEVDQVGNKVTMLLEDVLPNEIIEGRAIFQYGPSRGVGVTAQRIHFNRLRRRMGSGFYFNASVGGFQVTDTAAIAFGTIATTSRQGGAENEWSPSVGPSTFVNKDNQGAVLVHWPFGNNALYDGRSDRNSTPAKARASAVNGLHAFTALSRPEMRIEAASNVSLHPHQRFPPRHEQHRLPVVPRDAGAGSRHPGRHLRRRDDQRRLRRLQGSPPTGRARSTSPPPARARCC